MAEDIATSAPTTETASDPGTTNGVGTSPSTAGTDRGALREAALAALGEATEEAGEAPPTEEGETPPVVETRAEEPPPETPKAQLSPQLRAIALQEAHNRKLADTAKADREAASAERQALERDRAAFEAERSKPVTGGLDKYRSDLVAFADDHKLTDAERVLLATDLWHSAQPAEKRPATYRKQGGVLSEVESLKREYQSLSQKLKEKEDAEQKKADEAREEHETGELATAILTEARATETAPFVSALLEHNPKVVKKDLKLLAERLIKQADDPSTVTSEKVVMEYERLLDAQSSWIRKALQAKQPVAKDGTSAPPKGLPAAKALTNQGTASPTREQGPVTRDARREAALASLED